MSFFQSNEEKQFIRLVSGKTIVPLEFPHAYLQFSKDGETFKLNDIYQTETMTLAFKGMEREFAVYRDGEGKDVIYAVFKYLDGYGLGRFAGSPLKKPSDFL